MMLIRRRAVMALFAAAIACLGAGAAPAADAPSSQQGPQELMSQVAHDMLSALDSKRAEIRKDPAVVYPLVDKILLPHFDTEYAARLILAQSWRTATPEQREHFVKALYNALLKTYGGALGDFTADRLAVLPMRSQPTGNEAMVRTQVRRDNGQMVPVDYRMHKTADGWKAYDVIIEGISYVTNYRNDLGAEIEKNGLNAVIDRLDREGLKVDKVGKSAAAS